MFKSSYLMLVYFYLILSRCLAHKFYGTGDFNNACLDYFTEHNEREASKINSKISVVFRYKSYLIPARKFERNFHFDTTFPLQNLRPLYTLVFIKVSHHRRIHWYFLVWGTSWISASSMAFFFYWSARVRLWRQLWKHWLT